MMADNQYDNNIDTTALWIKEPPHVFFSGVYRFRRWLFPALVAVVILVLIIAVGASNTKTSNHLWTVEQSVSNLNNVIQSLNASLQHTQETAKEVKQLQAAVDSNKIQMTSVAEALKQLSVLDSLSNSIAGLKCSLERIMNNSSAEGKCCPLGWDGFGSSCYFFSKVALSWDEARVWCDNHGSHLVILRTDKEWDFVTSRSAPDSYWVGLTDGRTGKWEWVNHTPYIIERRRWEPGQPDNWTEHGLGPGDEDCAHLRYNGRLNDLHCSTKLRYICQKHNQSS
ncbi:C-type lectin domain family 10 member A [Mastacembelus armatus]|uniref:Asialoglycoprotein receptor-like 2 n=1 Tax=Mastacembelus armatus TaxID=205130 RepID=A0A3Q3LNS0_9TELE|nr:C-type lectin domain family 10 member A-like [Mastacembelus armatus]